MGAAPVLGAALPACGGLVPGAALARDEGLRPLTPGAKVAFFGLVWINSSPLPASEAELARVEMLEEMVAARFVEEGFSLVDLAPVRGRIDSIRSVADCYGCDWRMAATLEADYALVGEIQKVSNLILSMNLVLRSSADGAQLRGRAVDIRSNTDDSWRRGMRYILKAHYFPKKKG